MALAAVTLAGCGSSGGTSSDGSSSTSVPSYASEPFTPLQERIERGGHLVVSDGCSVCHLNSNGKGLGPDFDHFAGHRVKLANGRTALVNEQFLREGLTHPASFELRGYDPEPMLAALRRLDLGSHPAQVADLAAFIEEVGPEVE